MYASSATVYGDRGHLPHMTEDPAYPSNGYTKMKIECEKVFAEVGATCLRFSNLYGFGMSDNSVVADILRQIPGKGPIKIIDPYRHKNFFTFFGTFCHFQKPPTP